AGVLAITHLDLFGAAAWGVGIQSLLLTSGNIAEITTAGTAISADEEGRFSGLPAFMDIWTTGLLATRMQAGTRNTLLHVLITRAGADLVADPPRLLLNG